jgi:hypothetical protein
MENSQDNINKLQKIILMADNQDYMVIIIVNITY